MENYKIKDISLAESGQKKLDWAWQYMSVLRFITEEKKKNQPFKGYRIALCLHLEAKSACLALALKNLGADAAICGSNPLSTQDDVCAAMAANGLHVFSHHDMTQEEYNSYMRDVLATNPNIVIDDGGDMVAMILKEFPELAKNVLGGCEETTTGIKRLAAMEKQGVLPFPMFAVNDANSKHLFDNRYGTGQSTWDAICRTTNLFVAQSNVVVAGYGYCGKGTAKRAAGLGARVYVTELDPHKALEAMMDGFHVVDMEQASKIGDIFITVTGNINVITERHFKNMKDGVLLANAGHFDIEISKPDLEKLAAKIYESRNNITTYEMPDGRRLHLLGEGRLVNLAAGDGHPVEIMDMSFAMQLLAAEYFTKNKMPVALHKVPKELDDMVSLYKLKSMGLKLEILTTEQEAYMNSWAE